MPLIYMLPIFLLIAVFDSKFFAATIMYPDGFIAGFGADEECFEVFDADIVGFERGVGNADLSDFGEGLICVEQAIAGFQISGVDPIAVLDFSIIVMPF